MRCSILGVFLFLSLLGCVTEAPPAPASDYEELSPITVIESPDPVAGGFKHGNRILESNGKRRIATMPWQGYARLTDDDVAAMVAYLRSIEPIRNSVPKEVIPGDRATHPFVYFGVYRSKK